ncbi:MAG: Lrp/AsnC family transcriptional regulator [Desulfatibacillaceae bacterium]
MSGNNELNETERLVIAAVQKDIPVCERPYRVLAEESGITEDQFIDALRGLAEKGVMRRFGATLRHQKSGYRANAMVAWKVPEERVPEVGEILAGFASVSHCYRRDPAADWPYNLYTMVHAQSVDECQAIAREMSGRAGVDDYELLFSKREFKKTSMEYFPSDDDD